MEPQKDLKPTLISPGLALTFPINTEWKALRKEKLGGSPTLTEPLLIFLKDTLGRKWILEAEVVTSSTVSGIETAVRSHSVAPRKW